jgi:hypothetical protein
MDLEELKKRLYKKDDGLEDRPKPPAEFEPGTSSIPPSTSTPQWTGQSAKSSLSVGQKRIIWLAGILIILGLAVLAGWLFWRSQHSFDKNQVALEIFGQERLVSGEDTSYIVRYKNSTKTVLKNASLTFIFSADSIPLNKENLETRGGFPTIKKTVGDIGVSQEGQTEFKARVLGDKDSQQKFSAALEYQPANISSNFANKAEFTSTVISVPLILNFDLPDRLVSGQTVNFSLKYLNTSDAIFSDSKIKIEYPTGFNFTNALPSPSEGNNIWTLSEIGSREEGKLMIKGIVEGNEEETRLFKARIGTEKNGEFVAYAQALSSPRISVSPLYVEQILNEQTADLGQNLNYKLKYKNTTDATIGPVVITLKIDSQTVDFASVAAPRGFFSSSESTIIWNASLVPELNSLSGRAEGELGFSLKVKDKLPVNGFSDKNFTIVTNAQIDSPNVPLSLVGTQLTGKNQTIVKINSRLVLNIKGYYTDKLISNSGPLPPKVGQKTTYTIYWQVLNISNDLSEVAVEAYLPSYIQWQGNIYPKNENLSYDSATGKVVWQIGRLPAATGILTPVKQIAFQVGLTPSLGQVGERAVIIKNTRASGSDTFTQASVQVSANDLQSDMPDDPTVGWEKGRVGQ